MNLEIYNQKQKAILETAQRLFWKFGFKKVSIEEICRESNVSKMTFYKFYKNKPDLAKKVISLIMDKAILGYNEIMKMDIPFSEKVTKQLILKHELTNEISKEFVLDIFDNDKLGLKEYWQGYADKFSKAIMQDFKHAQKMGWIRKDLNLNFILYYQKKAIEMVYDPEINKMYGSVSELIMEITNMFFYGICNKGI